jgi:hypothetical protein
VIEYLRAHQPPIGQEIRDRRRSRPAAEPLEGRQLLSTSRTLGPVPLFARAGRPSTVAIGHPGPIAGHIEAHPRRGHVLTSTPPQKLDYPTYLNKEIGNLADKSSDPVTSRYLFVLQKAEKNFQYNPTQLGGLEDRRLLSESPMAGHRGVARPGGTPAIVASHDPVAPLAAGRPLADPAGTFPGALEDYTSKWPDWHDYNLDSTLDPVKKDFLVASALRAYGQAYTNKIPHMMGTEFKALLDPSSYVLTRNPDHFPDYFALPFYQHTGVTVQYDPRYYLYSNLGLKNRSQYWVDFSNVHLGGAVFGDGFSQEEIMCLETPELANASVPNNHVVTRNKNAGATSKDGDGLVEGSPNPWVFDDVTRVLNINTTDIYGKAFNTATLRQVKMATTNLGDAGDQQVFNVLAMTAPNLHPPKNQESPDALNIWTLDDVFNTAVAGFTLAKTDAANAKVTTPLVNSGKIGAGAFGGNANAAYVLQDLAARQTGVNLKLWGYTQAESEMATNDVNKILSLYPANASVKKLLSITHDVLTNRPTPTQTITWSNPADIVYGTPLSAAQLDATASVDGSFTYKPAAGTILGVGQGQTLSVTFTPTDKDHYKTAAATATINVLPTPTPTPTPSLVGAQVGTTYLRHKPNGKPVGKPVVTFSFRYDTAMNAATTANPVNYQVSWFSTKKVRRTVQTLAHSVRVLSVTPDASDTVFTVTTSSNRPTYKKGGQVTLMGSVPGGITSAAGVALSGNPGFRVSPRARGIG